MMRNRRVQAAALCGLLALAATLWADGPPAGCGCSAGGCGPAGCGHDACCHDCGKTVCKPICETKTVNKRVYTDGCEEYCTPSLLPSILGGCCSKVHTRKYLILKIKKCDYCCKKCIPVHEPTCAAPCGGGCGAAPCDGGCMAGHPNITVIHEGQAHGIALPPAAAPYPPASLPPAPMPAGK